MAKYRVFNIDTSEMRLLDGEHRLEPNFKVKEIACNCGCGSAVYSGRSLLRLQIIREEINQSITITSGDRCYKNNISAGSKTVNHILRGALDYRTTNRQNMDKLWELTEKYFGYLSSLGRYSTWIHAHMYGKHERW